MNHVEAIAVLKQFGYRAIVLQGGIWRVSRIDVQGKEQGMMLTTERLMIALAKNLSRQQQDLSTNINSAQ